MQAPPTQGYPSHSPAPYAPPAPPAPVGPSARYSAGQHLFQGPQQPQGGLAHGGAGPMPPSSYSPGLAPPTSQALRPYSAGPPRPASSSSAAAPGGAGYGPPRPVSTGRAGRGAAGAAPPRMPSSVYPPTPQMGGPRRPRKRLVICCDGTWLDSDNGLVYRTLQLPSNVTRIGRAIKAESSDGVAQVVYYQGGVGTEGGVLSRAVGGATAEGLSSNIREAYSFVAHNYSAGDEIFLVGFSRGAFTARSIAGLISAVGLLTKKGIDDLGVIFQDVEHQHDRGYVSAYPNLPFPNKPSAGDSRYAVELAKRGLSRVQIPIKAIAVWDTVGSLGIPRVPWLERFGLQKREVKEFTFYDTSLSDNVENAFQALAIDEHRSSFVPTVWEKPRNKANMTNLRQVWFPGVHSNVGGGYPDLDLSNITLAWMIAQLETMLEFNPEYLREQYQANIAYYSQSDQERRPWSFGEIYRSMTGIYKLAGRTWRTPGMYPRLDPATGTPTKSKLRDTHEYIHPSVRARMELRGPGTEDKGAYRPRAMVGYKLKLTGAPQGTNAPAAMWESRSRTKKGPRKVLLESPLFETERNLLEGSPWVAGYLSGRDGEQHHGGGGSPSGNGYGPGGAVQNGHPPGRGGRVGREAREPGNRQGKQGRRRDRERSRSRNVDTESDE